MTNTLTHIAGAALVILAGLIAYYAHQQDKADALDGVVTSDNAVLAVVFGAMAVFAAIGWFWGLPQ